MIKSSNKRKILSEARLRIQENQSSTSPKSPKVSQKKMNMRLASKDKSI